MGGIHSRNAFWLENLNLCEQNIVVVSGIMKNLIIIKIYKNSTVKIKELSMAFEKLSKLLKKILFRKMLITAKKIIRLSVLLSTI